MTSTEMAEMFTDIHDLGRKKNAKVELLVEIIEEYDPDDVYVLFRQFADDTFAHPIRALGVGKATMDTAAANAFFDGDTDRVDELRSEYGSLSQALRDEEIGTDGDPWLVTDLFDRQLDIEEASSDGEVTNLVQSTFEAVSEPWVFSQMVHDDMAMYCGGHKLNSALKEVTGRDDLWWAWGVRNDIALVFYDWAKPERELTTGCEPHDMIAEMKAEKATAERAAELTDDENWVAQTKYDGARVFVHHSGDGDYRAYMAGNQDVTQQLPELFEAPLSEQLPEFPFVIDGEMTPYDPDTGEVLPFQHILKRTGRDTDEMLDVGEAGVEVRFKFFDVLNWHGRDVSQDPYSERLQLLRAAFNPNLVARTGSDIEQVYQASLDEGHEGVVMKSLNHRFRYNERSSDWLKWKADPMETDLRISDAHEADVSTDMVGALGLQAKYDHGWVDVGAVGTGFTNHDRERLWSMYEAGELVGKTVQVSFEELQVSDDGSGAALRFPVFNALRPEGEPDSLERLAKIAEVEDEMAF
jgi:ATP-dependent DNA ligase